MNFVIEYEAPNYTKVTGAAYNTNANKPNLLPLYQRNMVTRDDLDSFLSIRMKNQAKKFYLSHGPLFFNAPLYAHEGTSSEKVIEHHAELILDAAKKMQEVFTLVDEADKAIEIEPIKAAIEASKQPGNNVCVINIERFQKLNVELAILKEQGKYELTAAWTPQLNDFYCGWLLLKESPFQETTKSPREGEVNFREFRKFKGKAAEVNNILQALIEKIVTAHLKDARMIFDSNALCMYPGSLITALWHQAAQAISGSTISYCRNCGLPIVIYKESKSGANKKQYCSHSCRSAAYSRRARAEEARMKIRTGQTTKLT